MEWVDSLDTNQFLAVLFITLFVATGFVLVNFTNLAANYPEVGRYVDLANISLFFLYVSAIVFFIDGLMEKNELVDFPGIGKNFETFMNSFIIGGGVSLLSVFSLKISFATVPLIAILKYLDAGYVTIIAPLTEELFFRGAVFGVFNLYLSNRVGYAGEYVAMVLSSIAFSLYHLSIYGDQNIMGLFVLGMIFSLGNKYMNSIGFSFGAHILHNTVRFVGLA